MSEQVPPEALARTREILAVADKIKLILAGRGADAQGAILAELMATWLHGHRALADSGAIDWPETEKLRRDLTDMHMATVTRLVGLADKPLRKGGGHD